MRVITRSLGLRASGAYATANSAFIRTRATARPLSTLYNGVPMGPADPILGLNESFNSDSDPAKVNLGVGAYRDDDGKPWVLPTVRVAEERLLAKGLNKEYLGISGLPDFINHSLEFAYGAMSSEESSKLTGVQTLSGTGAVRLGAEFFKKFGLAANNNIYLPEPTWGNHVNIFNDAGMNVERYPYYDRSVNGLALDALLDTINSASDGSIFLLHACAHNPTGMDPTHDQWDQIASAMKSKNHVAFFDCAYQGFASGDANEDAWALRHFVKEGNNVCLAQSYAKNFGLYGERVGCFSIVCGDAEEAKRVESQLKILIRPMYSNPPCHGARIVAEILGDENLSGQWRDECKGMAQRIHTMRDSLVQGLTEAGSTKDWAHVTKQIGMFCFTGLDPAQVERMKTEFHVYMTGDGRISMAGVTSKNVNYLAKALHEVTK